MFYTHFNKENNSKVIQGAGINYFIYPLPNPNDKQILQCNYPRCLSVSQKNPIGIVRAWLLEDAQAELW